jgi:hypothetical protein
MERVKKQTDYSKLYLKLTSGDENITSNANKNPFIFLSFYLHNLPVIIDSNDFSQSMKYQRTIAEESDYAFECFQLELNLLKNNKSDYLNKNVEFLFDHYEKSFIENVFVSNTIIKLFAKICQPPNAIYINSNNRKKLSKWFTVKEPITSFVLKTLPESKWFENRFVDKMMYGFENNFISKETSFQTFKALFEGKYLENKINWIDGYLDVESSKHSFASVACAKIIDDCHPTNGFTCEEMIAAVQPGGCAGDCDDAIKNNMIQRYNDGEFESLCLNITSEEL